MAKRGADFQMTKDSGGLPDFQFGGEAAGGPGGIQPQRATAQQMAKRKIATGKKARVGGAPAGAPAAESQSTFNFGAPPDTNGWAGTFGNTTTTFSSGGAQPPSAGSTNRPMFGGATTSFGAGVNGQSSSAPPASFNFGASSFNSSFTPKFGGENKEAVSSITKAPTFSFQPQNNHTPTPPTTDSQPSSSTQSPSNPFFTATSSNNSNPFASSTPALSQPEPSKNLFSFSSGNTSPAFSAFSPAKPAQEKNNTTPSSSVFSSAKPAEENSKTTKMGQTLSAEENTKARELLRVIKEKYQNPTAFHFDVKEQIDQLIASGTCGEYLKNHDADAQAQLFATNLQNLQVQLENTTGDYPTTFPAEHKEVLEAMMKKLLAPAGDSTPKNLFQTAQPGSQPQSTPLTSTSATSEAASATTQATSNQFQPPKASPLSSTSQPAFNPFTQSTTQSPVTTAAQPAQAASSMTPAEFRAMIVRRVVEKASASKPSQTLAPLEQLRPILSELLAEAFPKMKEDAIPLGMTTDQLQRIIVEVVEEARSSIDPAGGQSAPDIVRQAIDASLPKIFSTVQAAIAGAHNQNGASALRYTVDPMVELERFKKECEQAQPPRGPVGNLSFDDLDETQKKQATALYRISLFSRKLNQFAETVPLQAHEVQQLQAAHKRIRDDWVTQGGLKRKASAVDADDGEAVGAKRQKVNGVGSTLSASRAPLFATPTGNKRHAEDQDVEGTTKRARNETKDAPASSNASQTSQLFASIAGSPSKTPSFASADNGFQVSQAGNAGGLFVAGSHSTGTASNLFASAATATPAKGDTTASSIFTPKPVTSSTAQSGITGFQPSGTAATSDFMSQFRKRSDETAASDKEKRKLEDHDSDDETEEEWEKRDAAEQAAKRQKLLDASRSTTFTPQFGGNESASEAGKGNEADNEESEEPGEEDDEADGNFDADDTDDDEDDSEEESDEEGVEMQQDNGQGTAQAPSRSLFDRVQKPDNASPSKSEDSPASDKTWKPDTPIKFGDASGSAKLPSTSTFGTPSNNAAPKNPFGSFGAPTTSGAPSNPFGTPSASAPITNPFGTFNSTGSNLSMANPFAKPGDTPAAKPASTNGGSFGQQPVFSFTAASPQKGGVNDTNKVPAPNSNADASSGPAKSLFGFGSNNGTQSKVFENPFAKLAKPGSLPQINTPEPSAAGLAPTSIFASVTNSRATSPGMTTGEESTGSGADEEAGNDPQLDLSSARSGEEQEDAVFEIRAKVSELHKGDSPSPQEAEWVLRGVGEFRLLKNRETGKCRIIHRAAPASRVVLNTFLSPTTDYTHPTPKSVVFIASNAGQLSKWTVQVGKTEDATKLHEVLEKHKND